MSMNGLEDTPEALIAYVQACGIADPVGWLDARIPNWRGPTPWAVEYEATEETEQEAAEISRPFAEVGTHDRRWEIFVTVKRDDG